MSFRGSIFLVCRGRGYPSLLFKDRVQALIYILNKVLACLVCIYFCPCQYIFLKHTELSMIISKLPLFSHQKCFNLFPCLSEWMTLKFHDEITKETLSQFLCESNQLPLLTKIQLILYSCGQTKHSEEEREENSEGSYHLICLKHWYTITERLLQYIYHGIYSWNICIVDLNF